MTEAVKTDLYERDFYAWTRDQAARLRALGGHNAIDVERVAEELEDLGKHAVNTTAGNLERCFEHLVKLAVSPATAPVGKWRGEVYRFAAHARRYFGEGMRQRIDLDTIRRDAVRAASEDLRDYGEAPPERIGAVPLALDTVLDPEFDIDDAIAAVRTTLTDQSPTRES
jgi:hypothetical protein